MSTFKIEIIKSTFIFSDWCLKLPKLEIFCKYFLDKNPKAYIVLTGKNKKPRKNLEVTLKKQVKMPGLFWKTAKYFLSADILLQFTYLPVLTLKKVA